jgi:hypothetical protein
VRTSAVDVVSDDNLRSVCVWGLVILGTVVAITVAESRLARKRPSHTPTDLRRADDAQREDTDPRAASDRAFDTFDKFRAYP